MIIAILVLAVIGLLVWRFVGNSTETTGTQASSSQSSSVQTDPNKGYVVLDDWGVRFKPTDSTTYTYAKVTDTSDDIYGFSTDVLAAMGKYCVASEGRKGSVIRRTTADVSGVVGDPGQLLNTSAMINGYYYYYTGPQSAGCTDAEPTQQQLQTETGQVALIRNLIFTIEAKQ